MKIDVSSLLCYRLFFLVQTNRQLIDKQMKKFDFTSTQWQTLARFNFLPMPCTQQMLLKSMDIDRGHLTRTLDQLEQRKLITRTRLANDKRAFNVALTASGKKLLKQLEQVLSKESEILVSGFTDEEKQLLPKLINQVTANVLSEIKIENI